MRSDPPERQAGVLRLSCSPRALAAAAVYAAAYGFSLSRLSSAPGFETGAALAVMLGFGLGFSLAAWAATLGTVPQAVPVGNPRVGMAAISAYLVVFAVLFLGWGLSALRAVVTAEPLQSVAVLAAKLVVSVLIPAWLFTRLGRSWREQLAPKSLGPGAGRVLVVMGVLLLALQLTVGRGAGRIAALDVPVPVILALTPLAFAWMCLEAGLPEEFLFRALFQSNAAAWLRSETAGVVAMALVFGLAHAPGYVLRGAYAMEGMAAAPDPLSAAAYSIAVVSPIGLMFGVLWARTRNLWLVVLLHGWADLVPNLAPFIETWTGR